MADEIVTLVERTLGVADDILRNSFEGKAVNHVILAIAPDGAAVIRSNCGPETLRHLANVLIKIAAQRTPSPTGERH